MILKVTSVSGFYFVSRLFCALLDFIVIFCEVRSRSDGCAGVEGGL